MYKNASRFPACERTQERPTRFCVWSVLGYLVYDTVFEFAIFYFHLRDFWKLMRFVYLLEFSQSLVQELFSLPWNSDKLCIHNIFPEENCKFTRCCMKSS